MKVPFNKIPLSGNEISKMQEAIDSGYLQGGGKFMHSCEQKLNKLTQAKSSLLTTSCSSALDMSAILLNLKESDEVIIPTFTFVSTVNAFVLRGAKPVFADINPNTMNIDESKIEELITEKTKVIAPVHYAGVGCEMDEICAIAKKYNLNVVEDAAQGFMASYKGKSLGTIGDMGALSFHSTKNVIAGEGGALLVNDASLIDRANFVREKGTNRIHFAQGKIDKYTWIDYGSSFIPSELIAAFLDAQLDIAKELTESRLKAWNYYYNRLSALEKDGKIALAKVPDYCNHNAHIFFIDTGDIAKTVALSDYLKSKEISAVQHYAPLHSCPMAKTLGCDGRALPIAEKMAKTMLRLPIYSSITESELDYVCEALEDFYRA